MPVLIEERLRVALAIVFLWAGGAKLVAPPDTPTRLLDLSTCPIRSPPTLHGRSRSLRLVSRSHSACANGSVLDPNGGLPGRRNPLTLMNAVTSRHVYSCGRFRSTIIA